MQHTLTNNVEADFDLTEVPHRLYADDHITIEYMAGQPKWTMKATLSVVLLSWLLCHIFLSNHG
jgi:hypothetical protein